MRIVTGTIPRSELRELARAGNGEMVKAVVDLGRRVLALDADLHADLESLLLEDGAAQADLWGINLYPDRAGAEFVEYDSLINVRPAQGNRSREVESAERREAIAAVVRERVVP